LTILFMFGEEYKLWKLLIMQFPLFSHCFYNDLLFSQLCQNLWFIHFNVSE
jgi:hypothetical protein